MERRVVVPLLSEMAQLEKFTLWLCCVESDKRKLHRHSTGRMSVSSVTSQRRTFERTVYSFIISQRFSESMAILLKNYDFAQGGTKVGV